MNNAFHPRASKDSLFVALDWKGMFHVYALLLLKNCPNPEWMDYLHDGIEMLLAGPWCMRF